MTKQNEIREDIAAFLCNNYGGGSSWWYLSINHIEYKLQEYLEGADELLDLLHSQGVVVKITDEESPLVFSLEPLVKESI